MTATDELRRLLDKRGVEWKEHRHTMPGSRAIQRETLWGQPIDNASGRPIPHVYHCRATEMGDGRLFLEAQLVTPAQAIAATLGDGTCNISINDNLAETEGMGDVWLECDACGWQMPLEPSTPRFNFCPNCGRKVVDG